MRAIIAMDEVGGIGKNGTIPWHDPEDLRWFKEITQGATVIMGRKTYEDPKMPKPLSNRLMVVIGGTRDYDYPWSKERTIFMKSYDPVTLSFFRDPILIGGATLLNTAIENKDIEAIMINIKKGDYECDTKINMEALERNYKNFIHPNMMYSIGINYYLHR